MSDRKILLYSLLAGVPLSIVGLYLTLFPHSGLAAISMLTCLPVFFVFKWIGREGLYFWFLTVVAQFVYYLVIGGLIILVRRLLKSGV
jgi:hypothetical protein